MYIYICHINSHIDVHIYIVQSTWVDYDFDCYESCVMDLWVCIHRWMVVVGSTFTTIFWSPSHHDSRWMDGSTHDLINIRKKTQRRRTRSSMSAKKNARNNHLILIIPTSPGSEYSEYRNNSTWLIMIGNAGWEINHHITNNTVGFVNRNGWLCATKLSHLTGTWPSFRECAAAVNTYH